MPEDLRSISMPPLIYIMAQQLMLANKNSDTNSKQHGGTICPTQTIVTVSELNGF